MCAAPPDDSRSLSSTHVRQFLGIQHSLMPSVGTSHTCGTDVYTGKTLLQKDNKPKKNRNVTAVTRLHSGIAHSGKVTKQQLHITSQGKLCAVLGYYKPGHRLLEDICTQ